MHFPTVNTPAYLSDQRVMSMSPVKPSTTPFAIVDFPPIPITGILLLVILCLAFPVHSQQHQMPQDNWYYTGTNFPGVFSQSLQIGPDGNIYVATYNEGVPEPSDFISVFTSTGTLIRQFATNRWIWGLAVDSETNIFVYDMLGTNRISKFDSTGQLIGSFGSLGTNATQIGTPQYNLASIVVGSLICVDSNDHLYVADSANHRIQKYDKNGTWLTHWGEAANFGDSGLPSKFMQIGGLLALKNGNICVVNFTKSSSGATYVTGVEIQVFDSDGKFLFLKPLAFGNLFSSFSPSELPDGTIWVGTIGLVDLYAGDVGSASIGLKIRGLTLPYPLEGGGGTGLETAAFDERGTMYVSTPFGIFKLRRIYGLNAAATNSPSVTQPVIMAAKQRPNSSYVDIDYKITTPDTNYISVGILAFLNNGNSLANAKRITNFVENTLTNLGNSITANTMHRLTFDAAELTTNFISLRFEVLASDGRLPVPLDLITIPASGTNGPLTMSRSAVTDADLLSNWYWLLAVNDSAISFINGVITGVGGAYDSQALASGTTTTAQGRAFLYERMNIRAPTGAEITRAQSGNFGFTSVGGNNVVKLP